MKDIIEPWIPIVGLPNKMHVNAIHDDFDGFRIILECDEVREKFVIVSFVDFISYRNTDESFLLKIWFSTEKEFLGKTFYVVKSSSYIDFFKEMTIGFHNDLELKHFAIYTDTDCLDILTEHDPIVDWIPRME